MSRARARRRRDRGRRETTPTADVARKCARTARGDARTRVDVDDDDERGDDEDVAEEVSKGVRGVRGDARGGEVHAGEETARDGGCDVCERGEVDGEAVHAGDAARGGGVRAEGGRWRFARGRVARTIEKACAWTWRLMTWRGWMRARW